MLSRDWGGGGGGGMINLRRSQCGHEGYILWVPRKRSRGTLGYVRLVTALKARVIATCNF